MMYPSLPQSFFVGECFDAYRILGAHPAQGPHGEEGWRFTVWAPGATAVEICGGFDGWGPGVPMEKADTGLWSGFIAGLAEGDLYKYRVHGADGSGVLTCCRRAGSLDSSTRAWASTALANQPNEAT